MFLKLTTAPIADYEGGSDVIILPEQIAEITRHSPGGITHLYTKSNGCRLVQESPDAILAMMEGEPTTQDDSELREKAKAFISAAEAHLPWLLRPRRGKRGVSAVNMNDTHSALKAHLAGGAEE